MPTTSSRRPVSTTLRRRVRDQRVLLASGVAAAIMALFLSFGVTTHVRANEPRQADQGSHEGPPRRESTPTPGDGIDPAQLDQLLSAGVTDIDQYWHTVLPDTYGIDMTDVQIVGAYDGSAQPCGAPSNALWCSDGNYVVWNQEFMLDMARTDGTVAPVFVLAHEYGHAVQNNLGVELNQVDTELNADCLAGAWAGDALKRGLIDMADLDTAAQAFVEAGNAGGDHGSKLERVGAFHDGVMSGPQACIS
jgi:uncharacterized protein